MKVGDLIVHVSATPNAFRARLLVAIENKAYFEPVDRNWPEVKSKPIVVFVDGRHDWKELWRVFTGWE